MIRVAVVDDDAGYRRSICDHLRRYGDEHKIVFQIREFTDGDEITEKYDASYDIVFLDVVMNYMNGIDAAEVIRRQDTNVLIIFISNMPQFATKGYAVDALDYIIKPVSYPDFCLRLDRAMKRIAAREQKSIVVPIKNGFQKIFMHELYYVEVRDHDLMFHTSFGLVESKGTLSEIEARLDDGSFFRCNKCYLVNLGKVKGIRGCDVYVGGDALQMSRAKKKELMEAMNRYLNGMNWG